MTSIKRRHNVDATSWRAGQHTSLVNYEMGHANQNVQIQIILCMDSEGPDQPAQMRRLSWGNCLSPKPCFRTMRPKQKIQVHDLVPWVTGTSMTTMYKIKNFEDIIIPQPLYNTIDGLQSKTLLVKQSCGTQTKMNRLYSEKTLYVNIFLYDLYIFVWIRHFGCAFITLTLNFRRKVNKITSRKLGRLWVVMNTNLDQFLSKWQLWAKSLSVLIREAFNSLHTGYFACILSSVDFLN